MNVRDRVKFIASVHYIVRYFFREFKEHYPVVLNGKTYGIKTNIIGSFAITNHTFIILCLISCNNIKFNSLKFMNIKKLPPDIIRFIFEFHSHSFLLKIISLVCKEWKTHVWNHPPFWHTLKLNPPNGSLNKRLASQTAFKKFLEEHTKQLNFVRVLIQIDRNYVNIRNILEYSHHFTSLIKLRWNIWRIENLDAIGTWTTLTKLLLTNCDELKTVDGFAKLTNLTVMKLDSCESIHDIAPFTNLTNLTVLVIKKIQNVENIGKLTKLTKLILIHFNLQNVNDIAMLTNLTELTLIRCWNLRDLDGIENLTNLKKLKIFGCDNLQNIDALTKLTNCEQSVK